MIKLENITMNFGSTVAVNHASFSVEKGEILGLLGPNGAGKTTIMRILTTYIVPVSGKATVDGIDIAADPLSVRKKIGYLPETAPLYMDMLTSDYLRFVAKARGMSNQKIRERIGWVVEACAIKTVFKKTLNELSRGYKQRVGLAQALIHDPEILILDEPTSGLDPLQIIDIRNLIKGLAREKTIIFSTHILQEVVAVSDRVVIINEGKIIANGTVEELGRAAMRTNRSILTVQARKEEVEDSLRKIPGINSAQFLLSMGNNLVQFEITNDFDKEVWQDIDRLIKQKGWILRSYEDKSLSFEDTFIALTKAAKMGNLKRKEEGLKA